LLKDNGFLGGFTHLFLKLFLKLLAFFDDRVHLLGNAFIVALLKQGLLLLEFGNALIALGLDLSNAGVDSAACSRSDTEISSSRRCKAFLRASSST
jgi:hypothetical protein